MVVVGGVDHTVGVIIGVGFLTALQQVLQQQPHLADSMYSAIIIAVLLFGQTTISRRLLGLVRRIPLFAIRPSHG
jgi:ABC-type branched-subunit amino acid transport system permease subunit